MKEFLQSKQGKIMLSVAGVLVVIILTVMYKVGYGNGYDDKTIQLNQKKTTYEELLREVDKKKSELEKKTEKYDSVKMELANVEHKLEVNNENFEKFKKLKSQKGELQSKIEENKNQLSAVKSDIDQAESKLKDVQANIERAKGSPKYLYAGKFEVGKDVPTGRYKVVPVRGGSNFVVYGSTGGLKVNTILGGHGVNQYTFYAEDGDRIETESNRIKLIPMK